MQEIPTFWILFFASLMGLFLYRKALKDKRQPLLWFIIGALFGIFGIIAYFLTKMVLKKSAAPSQELKTSSNSFLELPKGAWWYAINNQIHGPCSAEFIKESYHNQTLQDEHLIWHESLIEWKKVKDFTIT